MTIRKCIECGSEEEVWQFKGGDLYCKKHYHEMYHFGEIKNLKGKRKENAFVNKTDHIEIQLDNGTIGLIDNDDLERIKNHYWNTNKEGYLHSRINGKIQRMQRFLLNSPDGQVDHINRNKTDNRKENLRVCSQRENSSNMSVKTNNTSGFPGVNKINSTGKWRARIMVNRKEIRLGHYESFEDAVEARKQGEIKYFGEFAPNVYPAQE